jgi:hypothetical protein
VFNGSEFSGWTQRADLCGLLDVLPTRANFMRANQIFKDPIRGSYGHGPAVKRAAVGVGSLPDDGGAEAIFRTTAVKPSERRKSTTTNS